MTDKKISELTALTGAEVDNTADVLPIVDVSDTTTAPAGAGGSNKKIKTGELLNAFASTYIQTLLDDADASAARATLGTYSTTQVDNLVNATAANVGKRSRVRAATTANITIATALNDGDTIDDVTLETDDLVLVKNQSTASENGVYVVGAVPARFAEFDTWDDFPGSLIAAQEGTANADTLWLCTSNTGGTLGTTAITFTKLVVAGELLAANNLSDVANATTARTNLGLGSIATQAADNVTISGGTISGITDLAVADGGTGAGTFTANGVLYGNTTSAIGATAAGTSGQALISGGSGSAPAYGTVCDVQVISATGDTTWTKPANAKLVYVWLCGGGGAGGSGEKNTSAGNAGGGGGGGGGGVSYAWFGATNLDATETITVGAGGTAGGTRNTTGPGADGGPGGDSKFTVGGTVALFAGGGGGGGGGGVIAAGYPGASGTTGNAMVLGGAGGTGGDGFAGNAATAGATGAPPGSAGGGGGGGGTTSTTTARAAAAGGDAALGTGTTGAGLAGGAATGGAGTSPPSAAAIGGAGGGGGAARTSNGNGNTGGAGGFNGGGGGGGGNGMGASGTNNNGNGGVGRRGLAVIITFR